MAQRGRGDDQRYRGTSFRLDEINSGNVAQAVDELIASARKTLFPKKRSRAQCKFNPEPLDVLQFLFDDKVAPKPVAASKQVHVRPPRDLPRSEAPL